MKVKIPTTLAEPLTIPWFIPMLDSEDLVEGIKDAIRYFFLEMEKRNQVPNPEPRFLHMSVEDFLHILEHIAEKHGGINVYGFIDKCMDGTKHIGNAYYVYFRVPNDPQLYNKCMISWFIKNRTTVSPMDPKR